jgi:hypothetical protein
MKLQCVTVSVNYSDFLYYVLEENKNLFDRWVIVTNTKDIATKELCDKYKKNNVVCIQTDSFYTDGAKFNKYAGINDGLKLIDDDAWVLFLDSDIILHNQTRRVLENLNLNKEFIYGIDRVNCKGKDNWDKYSANRNMINNNWLLTIDNSIFEFGARLIHLYGHEGGDGSFAGWNPIGYFQLAHRSAFVSYPQNSSGADHCDMVFSRLWTRDKRILIPELMAIHIESYFVVHGVNWYGRLSEPFDSKKSNFVKIYIKNALTLSKIISKKIFKIYNYCLINGR